MGFAWGYFTLLIRLRFFSPQNDRQKGAHHVQRQESASENLNHLTQPMATPLEFNSSPLKNGGWKTSLSYWVKW